MKHIYYQLQRLKLCKKIDCCFFFNFSLILNSDQQNVKRIPKKIFSPYMTKISLPSFLTKPSSDVCNIFKSKDSSTSSNTDLSTIILTPSSSSSLLDATDDQTIQITNT